MSCALPAFAAASNTEPAPPFAVLMELTHRCPLRCPYCSNPVALDPASAELDTATWKRVLDEAADAGALQVHFSGGEPCVRKDLEELVAHATEIGLYSNLITSAVLLDQPRLERLQQAGLQHVQISLQDSEAIGADRVGGFKGGHAKKLEVARAVVRQGLALTINAVLHRHNIDRVNDVIDLAMDLGAGRIEIANVQYYGWALANRAALMPSRDQLLAMDAAVRARLPELAGRIVVDYVVPDYSARRPKSCMGGWARRFMNVNPAAGSCPAMRRRRFRGWSSRRCTTAACPRSGATARPSPATAAPTGCRSPANPATTRKRIGAVAVVRHWRLPVAPMRPTRCANCRPPMPTWRCCATAMPPLWTAIGPIAAPDLPSL